MKLQNAASVPTDKIGITINPLSTRVGFLKQLEDFGSRNSVPVNLITKGIVVFCIENKKATIIPIEYLDSADLIPIEQYYGLNITYNNYLERLVYTQPQIQVLQRMTSVQYTTATTTLDQLNIDCSLQYFRLERAQRGESHRSNAIEKSFLYRLLRKRVQINMVNTSITDDVGGAFYRWMLLSGRTSKSRVPASFEMPGGPVVSTDEVILDVQFEIDAIMTKARKVFDQDQRRASSFGVSRGSSSVVVSMKDLGANVSCELGDLFTSGLKNQSQALMERDGAELPDAKYPMSALHPSLIKLIEVYSVQQAGMLSLLKGVAAKSTTEIQSSIADMTSDASALIEERLFDQDFVIISPGSIGIKLIASKLDLFSSEVAIETLLESLGSMRVSKSVSDFRYASLVKATLSILTVLEHEHGFTLSKLQIIKWVSQIYSEVSLVDPGASPQRCIEKVTIANMAKANAKVRAITDQMTGWDRMLTEDQAMSDLYGKTIGGNKTTKSAKVAILKSLLPDSASNDLVLATVPFNRGGGGGCGNGTDTTLGGKGKSGKGKGGKGAKDGGKGDSKNKRTCVYHYKSLVIPGSEKCSLGSKCPFNHKITMPLNKDVQLEFTCKKCGKFLCPSIGKGRFGRCDEPANTNLRLANTATATVPQIMTAYAAAVPQIMPQAQLPRNVFDLNTITEIEMETIVQAYNSGKLMNAGKGKGKGAAPISHQEGHQKMLTWAAAKAADLGRRQMTTAMAASVESYEADDS